MASKTTLNAKNLEALGAPRLAELLIAISTGSAAHKQVLRLALAGSQGSAEAARAVRRRLTTLGRAQGGISWRKVRSLAADLDAQLTAIVETVAAEDPDEAFSLIWQFLMLAEPLYGRMETDSDLVLDCFHRACVAAGRLAEAAKIAPERLADLALAAMVSEASEHFDPLIPNLAPVLGVEGLQRLRAGLRDWEKEAPAEPEVEDQIIGWSSNGPIRLRDIRERHRTALLRRARETIADALGDVDGFIAEQAVASRRLAPVATEIARRLLKAGRAEEALQALDAATGSSLRLQAHGWQEVRAEALEALQRGKEAQDFRWSCFVATLDDLHLRAYLRRLPDFDDVEGEQAAFAVARQFAELHRALLFFLRWPDLAEAARLLQARAADIDGDDYELLGTAAEALAEKHPLAATMALRAMIDFSLDNARSSRYKHAARHLAECARLARRIETFDPMLSHEAYVVRLRRLHGKKPGFWSQVSD